MFCFSAVCRFFNHGVSFVYSRGWCGRLCEALAGFIPVTRFCGMGAELAVRLLIHTKRISDGNNLFAYHIKNKS
jgi:hypothetical protein